MLGATPGSVKRDGDGDHQGPFIVRWAFAQFDLVPLWIDDPGKLAAIRFIDLVDDVASYRPQRRNQGVKVFDPGSSSLRTLC